MRSEQWRAVGFDDPSAADSDGQVLECSDWSTREAAEAALAEMRSHKGDTAFDDTWLERRTVTYGEPERVDLPDLTLRAQEPVLGEVTLSPGYEHPKFDEAGCDKCGGSRIIPLPESGRFRLCPTCTASRASRGTSDGD